MEKAYWCKQDVVTKYTKSGYFSPHFFDMRLINFFKSIIFVFVQKARSCHLQVNTTVGKLAYQMQYHPQYPPGFSMLNVFKIKQMTIT